MKDWSLAIVAITLIVLRSPCVVRAEEPAAVPAPPGGSKWELRLDAHAGVPSGYVQVREFELKGTRLRLRDDLGVDTSEAVGLTTRYHLTARDAIRANFIYYFLDGTSHSDRARAWDGQAVGPGRITTNLDFMRLTAAYERALFDIGDRGRVTGSGGLTYVHLNARLDRKAEDFYLQEFPVPLVGARFDYRLTDRLAATASLEGGALPRVDSLRTEGGTVYLEQRHADAGLGLTYALRHNVSVGAGYSFTYFFQHENSHEDDNRIQLMDHAVRLHVDVRF